MRFIDAHCVQHMDSVPNRVGRCAAQVLGVSRYPNDTTQAANATTGDVATEFLINSFAAQLSAADLAVMKTFTAQAPFSQAQVVTGEQPGVA